MGLFRSEDVVGVCVRCSLEILIPANSIGVSGRVRHAGDCGGLVRLKD